MLVAMLIEDTLADFGCEIIGPAARVEQALKMIETTGPLHAAVLDVNLIGEKSYSVADDLAARDVPFLFMTGYRRESLFPEYRSFPILQKPVGRRALGDALAKLVMPGPHTYAIRSRVPGPER